MLSIICDVLRRSVGQGDLGEATWSNIHRDNDIKSGGNVDQLSGRTDTSTSGNVEPASSI